MSIIDRVGEQILKQPADKENERAIRKIPRKKREKLFRPLFKPTPSEKFRKSGKRLTIDNI